MSKRRLELALLGVVAALVSAMVTNNVKAQDLSPAPALSASASSLTTVSPATTLAAK